MTENTTEPRWPLAGNVTVKGDNNVRWYFETPKIGLEDDPTAWLKNHPNGDLHDELTRRATEHGFREKIHFRVDKNGLVTDTDRMPIKRS